MRRLRAMGEGIDLGPDAPHPADLIRQAREERESRFRR
jgi:hypothetical protein